jgi:uncharacterized membrane protein YbhN (UPF0104 family)
VLVLAVHAVHGSAPIAVIVLAYMLGQLGNALPLPGGVGGVEPAMLGVVTSSGVDLGLGAAAVVLYRLVSLGIQSLGGALAVSTLIPALQRDRQRQIPGAGDVTRASGTPTWQAARHRSWRPLPAPRPLGPPVIAALIAGLAALWIALRPAGIPLGSYLGQLLVADSVLLFSVALVLVSTLPWVEAWFDGVDRAMIWHRRLAIAGVRLLVHIVTARSGCWGCSR